MISRFLSIKQLALVATAAGCCAVCNAGGDLPAEQRRHADVPDTSTFYNTIKSRKIGTPADGNKVQRDAPLPAPSRSMCRGRGCNEFYGPTYYYPSYHNTYESLNPSYYPFYHPRLWPNYKVDGEYVAGKYCGPSRSMYQWDQYDDWVRGGRYEEHQ